MSTGSIVCAIDHSEAAARALAVGSDLRQRLGLRLVLAHVLRPVPTTAAVFAGPMAAPPLGPLGELESKEAAIDHLQEVARRNDLEGVTLRSELGAPDEVIARIAREEEAELLVTASRGRGRLRAALLGSFSAGMAAGAPCPVVIVPPESEEPRKRSGPRAVVCGIDESERAPRVLRFADAFASSLGRPLVLAHIAPMPHWPGTSAVPGGAQKIRDVEIEDAEHMLAELLAANPTLSPTMRRVAFGDPGGSLSDLAEEEGAEFIVVGSRGLGPLSTAVFGGVTGELIGSSRTPIVVVPPGVLLHGT